jgi:hypothetical protein
MAKNHPLFGLGATGARNGIMLHVPGLKIKEKRKKLTNTSVLPASPFMA